MILLSLDTTAAVATAALFRDGVLLAEREAEAGKKHAETALPMMEQMLEENGVAISQIDCFAVDIGPGSFTGVRIGVSAVKGLAWAADKPVCGVSTLLAMAYNGVVAQEGSVICCAMDARRGQFYNALFIMRDGVPVRLCEDRAIGAEKLVEDIKNFNKPVFIVGDGAHLCYNTLNNLSLATIVAPEPVRYQTAWGVCMAALRETPVTAHALLPVYLRLSQAERERQEKCSCN